jgi:polysaccharide biosynthesis transport protein
LDRQAKKLIMLQIRKPEPLARFSAAAATAISPRDLLASLSSLARRRFGIIVLIFSVCVLCGAIYLYVAAPKFLAQASILIDTRKTQLFQQQSVVGDSTIDSSAVDSQIEVLKSEAIAAAVVKQLHLTGDAEFGASKPGILGSILSFLTNATPPSETDLEQRAQGVFRAGILPKRVAGTYVVDIGFISLSPQRAAQIANATADAYVDDQLETKYQVTRRAGVWLQQRIQELQQEASTAEKAVLDFKKANNIVDTGGRLIGEQQLAELNSQIVIARAATAEAKARLDRTSEITKNGLSNLDNVIKSPDPSVADTLRSDVISKLRTQFLDTSNQEAIYAARLGRDHLVVVNLRNQMYEMRKSIFDELRRIEETFKSDYQIALAREQSVQKSLAETVAQSQNTNQAQISLRDLDSKAQTFRAIHDTFVQKYMESLQQQSFPYTEARVISHAVPPRAKSQPNSLLVMMLASASGLMLAFGVALLIDISESGFRTSDQVEEELRTSCLAVVPQIKIGAETPGAAAKPGRGISRQIEQNGVLSSVLGAPFSRFAEAFRTIKVSIDLFALSKPTKSIGITSTHPNEGKSTISANLARLIAHAGGKAILLDCDLRNPSLTRALAPGAELGLLDVITGKRLLTDVIWTDPTTSLAFLPMVAKTRLSHTNEILASGGMKKLIDALRGVYDYVLIDLPPLTPVVDVRSTNQIVDSYLFVIEWGQTSVESVERALSSAPLVYDNLMGVVLNKADLKVMRNYSRNAQENYKTSYCERYGFED